MSRNLNFENRHHDLALPRVADPSGLYPDPDQTFEKTPDPDPDQTFEKTPDPDSELTSRKTGSGSDPPNATLIRIQPSRKTTRVRIRIPSNNENQIRLYFENLIRNRGLNCLAAHSQPHFIDNFNLPGQLQDCGLYNVIWIRRFLEMYPDPDSPSLNIY